MKKIIGFLIITAFFAVGCSNGNLESDDNIDSESVETESDIAQNENSDEIEEDTNKDKDATNDSATNENSNSSGEVKSKILIDLMNSKKYTMQVEIISSFNGQETKNLSTTVVADDMTYSNIESENGNIKNIEKGNDSFLIMDDEKTIIKSNRYTDEEEDFSDPSLVYDDLEFLSEGKDKFLGNERSFEEYKIELGKVRYYFDKNEIDGMELYIDMEKLLADEDEDYEISKEFFENAEVSLIYNILSLEKTADMTVFELPKDYKIVGE